VSKKEKLTRVNESQIKKASETLARAFQDYPEMKYVLPNEDERRRKLPKVFEFMVNFGIFYGEVYGNSPNLEGIAVWFPFWEAEITKEKFYKHGGIEFFSIMGEEFVKRYMAIRRCEDTCHKLYADFSHWYLSPIGVDPDFQGNGNASLLLRAKFEEIDKQNIPCYLETHSEKNVSLYQHFGFKICGKKKIPGTGLTQWSMMRKKD
jgi:ribosomal protein S18 acetylase RimI-like enzyme